MKVSRKALAAIAILAVAIPGIAIAQQRGPENVPAPAKAYGVICERPPYDAARDSVEFGRCVRALAQGTNGNLTPREAAGKACRQSDLAPRSEEFRACVLETRDLVVGLRALKSR